MSKKTTKPTKNQPTSFIESELSKLFISLITKGESLDLSI